MKKIDIFSFKKFQGGIEKYGIIAFIFLGSQFFALLNIKFTHIDKSILIIKFVGSIIM